MTTLVTGVAGFIGYHTATRLLARGDTVVGIDSLSDYYSVALKQARLDQLTKHEAFTFHRLDLAERTAFETIRSAIKGVVRAIHLAAQPGVRHSIEHPFDYVDSNLVAHMTVLELCRHNPEFEHLVYGSSSSVYGANTKLPFSTEDRVERPVSLYAATKLANEHMSYSYAHLYGIPQTGLRFFTVYGPWGRPDMAVSLFTDAIFQGHPIELFNNGEMKRDFTYIDDIVNGIIAAHDHPPQSAKTPPHRIYNIGSSEPEPLLKLVGFLEKAIGKEARLVMKPMQKGEVLETYADIAVTERELEFKPTVGLDVGIPEFVDWFKTFHKI